MKIQSVAKKTGLSIHTLRYYERIGLIGCVDREQNGHRDYGPNDIDRIQFVLRLRSAGMPISNIKRYMELAQGDMDTVVERLQLLEDHQQAVEQHIDELQQHLTLIRDKIAHYREINETQLAMRNGTISS